ncbi:MAG: SRPBCC family protein [Chitinophagales bacterium]
MESEFVANVSLTIYAPVTKVWDYLTQPELIKQYFFGTDTHTDWKEGSPITFTGEWEGKKYEDKGTILQLEPQKLIKYTYWSSMSGIEDKPENYVTITYDLYAGFNKTILTITQENIPTEEMKNHSEENWKKVLAGLKELVEE